MNSFYLSVFLCCIILIQDAYSQSEDTCDDGYSSIYSFLYCLSDTAYCSQCQPCWNNHTVVAIQNGTSTCDESDCDFCIDTCEDYASVNYETYIDDKCNLLSNFIETIVTGKRMFQNDNFDNDSFIEISCSSDSKSVLSIQWASILSPSFAIEFASCSANLISEVSNSCDGKTTCKYYYENDASTYCNVENTGLLVEIGAYCTLSNSNSDYKPNSDVSSNSDISFSILYILMCLIGLFTGVLLSVIVYKGYKKRKGHKWATQGNVDKNGSQTVPSRQHSDIDAGAPAENGSSNYIPPNDTQNGKPSTHGFHGRNNSVQIYEADAPFHRRGSESYPASNVQTNPQFPANYGGNNIAVEPQKLGVEYRIDAVASNQQLALDLANPQVENEYGELVPRERYNPIIQQRRSFSAQRPSQHIAAQAQQARQPQQYNPAQQQQVYQFQQQQQQQQQQPQQQQQQQQHSQQQQQQQQQSQQAYGNQYNMPQQQQQYYSQQNTPQQGPQGPQGPQGQQYPQYMQPPGPIFNPNTGGYDQPTAQFLTHNDPNNPNSGNNGYNNGQGGNQMTFNNNGNFGTYIDASGRYYTPNNMTQQGNIAYNTNGTMLNTTNNPNGMMNGMMELTAEEQSHQHIIPIQYTEILFEAEIGRGSSGKVFKARWRNNQVVAKRFRSEDVDEKKAQSLIDDLTESANVLFDSPHVLQIYGYCKNTTLPFCLVTEYMDQGSVKNYVRKDRPGATSISTLERLEIALQAAKGLQHLHNCNFIHRDLAARNILYSQSVDYPFNKRVVVADYGLSSILNDEIYSATYTNVGPLKWMAPEAISDFKFSKESDIYSFGITLWELLTGQDPYPDVDPVNTAVEVLVKQRRPQLEHFNVPSQIKKLLRECWDKEVTKRPPVEDIVKVLAEFIDQEKKLLESNDEYYEY